MSDERNLSDDEMSTERPTERDENLDQGGEGPLDTGDEPTEAGEDLDRGGEGERDTGDA